MGFFDDIFGDEKDRDRAMQQAFRTFEGRMRGYLNQFQDRFENRARRS